VISAKEYEQNRIESFQAEKSGKSLESSILQTRELINNSKIKSRFIEKTLIVKENNPILLSTKKID